MSRERTTDWWATYVANRLLAHRAARVPKWAVPASRRTARDELGLLTRCRPDGQGKGKWLVTRKEEPGP